MIENHGTHNMYIEEGVTTANAATTNASILVPGLQWHCGDNVVVLGGAVQIYGTSGDTFYAATY